MKSEWDDWLNEEDEPEATARMDGVHTPEDYANKDTIMMQCKRCRQWSEQKLNENTPCPHCNSTDFDMTSSTSLRSFNPLTAKNRKPKGQRK